VIDPLEELPTLDAHAHIATDVTSDQVRELGHSYTFAVTRSLDEAHHVSTRYAHKLTWGVGVHPGVATAQANYDERMFAALLPRFSLVGEIGLDRRAGHIDRQAETLASILHVAAEQPVLLSLHSNGANEPLVDLIEDRPHPGTILHWWADDGSALDRAVATGAYFSVNAAMRANIIARLPIDRVLTETDYPARRAGGRKPGDTRRIESILATAWALPDVVVRRQVWSNLRRLATSAGALDRLPEALVDRLEHV
jgi:TatD DNase family protein